MSTHKHALDQRIYKVQAQARAESLNALPAARHAAKARAEGALRPEEYFTQRQLIHKPYRVEEARSTVDSRLRSKEEFPQG